jgi:phosphoribosylglycinamide formyltransferase 1
MEPRARIVVMASGNGSNAQAVIDACASGHIKGEVVAVVCDRADARVLSRADASGIPDVFVGRRPGELRADYDARLADVVSGFDPDHVVLLGWMRILTSSFLGWFPHMVVNLHPALPGELPGTDAIARAFDEFQRGVRDHSGVMVHLVPDEGIDDGPALASTTVAIEPTDTLDSFEQRMHEAEHRLIVDTLTWLCSPTPNGSLRAPHTTVRDRQHEETQR